MTYENREWTLADAYVGLGVARHVASTGVTGDDAIYGAKGLVYEVARRVRREHPGLTPCGLVARVIDESIGEE